MMRGLAARAGAQLRASGVCVATDEGGESCRKFACPTRDLPVRNLPTVQKNPGLSQLGALCVMSFDADDSFWKVRLCVR